MSRGQKWSSKYDPNEVEDTRVSDGTGINMLREYTLRVSDEMEMDTLHEETVRSLSRAIIKYARLVGKKYTEVAAELAREAMVIVAEGK